MVEIKLFEKLKEAYEVTTHNYNAFKNIYEILDIVCDISSIDVGSALSIKVRLKKPIDINHKVCLSDINKILLFSKTELIFTPDNYNIYQEIVISSKAGA